MKPWYAVPAVVGIAVSALLQCSGNRGAGAPENRNALAYVGPTLITRQDADAFEFVSRYVPGEQDTFGLARNGQIWALIATEAIYQQECRNPENGKIRSGREWELKRRSYLANAFEIQILQGNCGYADAEVRNYYDAHRDDFRTITYSDAAKPCTTNVVPPFDSIRGDVAKKLFMSSYKHDSGSLNLNDPRLFKMFRERMYRDHFLKKYYLEKYGKVLPDSIRTLCGSNAVIDTGDLNLVLSWMSAADRDSYKKDPSFIIRRLLQWKLFEEKAMVMNYASKVEVEKVLSWAWKNEIVRHYIRNRLAPVVEKSTPVDPAMALFSCWDESGSPSARVDSAKLKDHGARLALQKKALLFDSLVYAILKGRGVTFLTPDTWSDGRVREPGKLLREADSLRDSGSLPQAQTFYNILTDYYLFTAEGRTALFELAKLQAEQQEQGRLDAIKNFRLYCVLGGNRDRWCEVIFRIAFIYDQFLHRKEMAGVNYRWVLKNAPDCTFAGDAEVMLRHLGKPMPDAETLRAEAKRGKEK